MKWYLRLVRVVRVPFTTAWRVLRFRVEGRPPDTEGICEYVA
jgi:hypothetical protein